MKRGRKGLRAGLTLVELLVALVLLSVMASLGWRGLQHLSDQQRRLQTRGDEVHDLHTALAQWQVDHQRLSPGPERLAWDWDGQVLRLTRTAADPQGGWQVVAWAWQGPGTDPSRAPGLYRWQSPPLRHTPAWRQAWQAAQTWAQSPTAELRANETWLMHASAWRLWVHRSGAWSNPLSSPATAERNAAPTAASAAPPLPDAVRLMVERPTDRVLPGLLQIDIGLHSGPQGRP